MARKPPEKKFPRGGAIKAFKEAQKFQEENREALDLYRKEVEAKFEDVRPLMDKDTQQYVMETKIARIKKPTKFSRDNDYHRRIHLERNPPSEERLAKKALISAAQAALILGQEPALIALQYGLKMSDIYAWRDTLLAARAIDKRDRLSDMLLLHIEQEIKSLMTISIVTEREEWILAQGASELAQYYAVKADRLFAVLQAFGRVQDSREAYVNQLDVIPQEDKDAQ